MGHLTKWLFFNLLFGGIPYALTVALNQLHSPGPPLLRPSVEVLFIAVVATSSALGELWDREEDRLPRRSSTRELGQLALLLGVLSTSLLYGAYVYHSLLSPGRVYGVDCSVLAEASFQRLVSRRAVSTFSALIPACEGWAAIQAGFFRWSLWLTGFWVIVSTAAVSLNSRRRWRHGMV